jgi:hypothetical protein
MLLKIGILLAVSCILQIAYIRRFMFNIEEMDRVELNRFIESVFNSMLDPKEKSEILKKAYARLEKLNIKSALLESSDDVDFE